jgi:hypothetical protein
VCGWMEEKHPAEMVTETGGGGRVPGASVLVRMTGFSNSGNSQILL